MRESRSLGRDYPVTAAARDVGAMGIGQRTETDVYLRKLALRKCCVVSLLQKLRISRAALCFCEWNQTEQQNAVKLTILAKLNPKKTKQKHLKREQEHVKCSPQSTTPPTTTTKDLKRRGESPEHLMECKIIIAGHPSITTD